MNIFLYISSDIDTNMLQLMYPYEKHAVFIDPLSDDWSYGEGKYVISEYKKKHVNDKRHSLS